MSKFEIKLGNATHPLVISDKENRCLEVTFADETYTFGAKLREVRLELCYHLFNYMVTKGVAPTYAAVFTEEYVNGTPIQVCSSSYVTLRDKVHQRDERYKSWYEYCAFLGAENPYLTGQTEIGDVYWDYVVDRSGKIDLTRFTN